MQSSEDWTDIAPGAVRPALYVYKNRHLIQKYWKKMQVAVGVGKPNVVITGRPGAGKSVLAAHYHGEANTLDWNMPGTSPNVEVKPITVGEWTKIVHVIPGQDSRSREIALDTAFSNQGLEGVIHVVDWGYTTNRDAAVQRQMIANGIDTVEKFRAQNLESELLDFKRVSDHISRSISAKRGPKWLVLAVNKIDLYEPGMEDARQYYHPSCSGPFGEIVNELLNKVGAYNLKVACLPICPQPEPFVWGEEKIVSQIDSVSKQKNYMRRFIDDVAEFQRDI